MVERNGLVNVYFRHAQFISNLHNDVMRNVTEFRLNINENVHEPGFILGIFLKDFLNTCLHNDRFEFETKMKNAVC